MDDLAELCAAMAREQACEIMDEIKPNDLTACEIVALAWGKGSRSVPAVG